mgnify:CR=1 FL=1
MGGPSWALVLVRVLGPARLRLFAACVLPRQLFPVLPGLCSPSSDIMATQAAALRSKLFGGGGGATAELGGATAMAGPHTTEALRQATDRLLKEQASAELSVGLYRQKLVEAAGAVRRLEEAYVQQHQLNAKLQGACRGAGGRTAWGGGGETAASAAAAGDRCKLPLAGLTAWPQLSARPHRSDRLHRPPCRPPAARVKSDYTALESLRRSVSDTASAHRALRAEYEALAAALQEAELERTSMAASFARKSEALGELEASHERACAAGRDLQGRLDEAAAARAAREAEAACLQSELADRVGAASTLWVLVLGWRVLVLGWRVVGAVQMAETEQRAQHPPHHDTCVQHPPTSSTLSTHQTASQLPPHTTHPCIPPSHRPSCRLTPRRVQRRWAPTWRQRAARARGWRRAWRWPRRARNSWVLSLRARVRRWRRR